MLYSLSVDSCEPFFSHEKPAQWYMYIVLALASIQKTKHLMRSEVEVGFFHVAVFSKRKTVRTPETPHATAEIRKEYEFLDL